MNRRLATDTGDSQENKKVLDRLQKEKKARAKEERLAKAQIDKLWQDEEDAELKKIEEAREMQVSDVRCASSWRERAPVAAGRGAPDSMFSAAFG